MALFKLCNDDPLLNLLRDTFFANPIKVPETRISPLCVIAKTKNKEKVIGRLEQLLTDYTPFPIKPKISKMANVSAQKTKTVNFKLGFEVMDGFLKGMGVSGASIKANFDGVKNISFSFKNVNRDWIDIGYMGNFLSNKKLNIKYKEVNYL